MESEKPKGFGNFDDLMKNLVKVPLDAVLTEKQKMLRRVNGTPEEFANACSRLMKCSEITPDECEAAIDMYNRDWSEAGQSK